VGRHTLYAYVDGSDLDEVVDEIEQLLAALVAREPWVIAQPWVVNERHERDESHGPEDLDDWDLGLNLDLPDTGSEPAGWFQDVERVARIVGQVALRTGREFVIGIGDNETGISEDLFHVRNGDADLDELRAVTGRGGPSTTR
jgi:hypothetical protein